MITPKTTEQVSGLLSLAYLLEVLGIQVFHLEHVEEAFDKAVGRAINVDGNIMCHCTYCRRGKGMGFATREED